MPLLTVFRRRAYEGTLSVRSDLTGRWRVPDLVRSDLTGR